MPNDIANLRTTIVPKSDQLNAEQLLHGPMTITIEEVRLGSTDEQPIALHYRNDGGRPYKPCKTMRKVLIFAWGEDGRAWAGKSMTLYNDPRVKFGGEDVGGIRISHLSDIPKDVKVSLTATKGKKALHEIKVLQVSPQQRPVRTERHDSMVADLETLARENGADALKDAWNRLDKADKHAIGSAELDRLKKLCSSTTETTT